MDEQSKRERSEQLDRLIAFEPDPPDNPKPSKEDQVAGAVQQLTNIAKGTQTCPQCFGAGWVLDCKLDKNPTTLELIRCIYPPCTNSGRDVAVLCLYGRWDRPVLHPVTGAVMSLSRFPEGDSYVRAEGS